MEKEIKYCPKCLTKKDRDSFDKTSRICKKCNREKSLLYYKKNKNKLSKKAQTKYEFLKKNNKEKWFILYHKNKKKFAEQQKEFVLNYKKSHKCILCGETDFRCLDFHHRNKKEKFEQISKMIFRYSLKKLKLEMMKCDVLCSNCHRKLHYNEKNTPLK